MKNRKVVCATIACHYSRRLDNRGQTASEEHLALVLDRAGASTCSTSCPDNKHNHCCYLCNWRSVGPATTNSGSKKSAISSTALMCGHNIGHNHLNGDCHLWQCSVGNHLNQHSINRRKKELSLTASGTESKQFIVNTLHFIRSQYMFSKLTKLFYFRV